MLCRCGVGVAQQLPKLLGRVRISSFAFKSCNDGGAMKGAKRDSSNLCGSAYKKIAGKAMWVYVP